MALTETSIQTQIWITVPEALAIFGKASGSMSFALWKDRVKARQAVVGATWLVEYNSCVSFWGAPKRPDLVALIVAEVNNG